MSVSPAREFIIKPRPKTDLGLKELSEYRELFYFFTWRDVKVKYKQTFLGFSWAVLQPLLMTLIFTLLIGRVFQVSAGDLPYPVFVFAGLMLWNLFSGGLLAASSSMLSNAGIIKKIYFPRLIIPLSSICVSVFDFLMTLPVFLILLLVYDIPVEPLRLLLASAIAVALIVLTAFGPGCILAALNVKYRDFRYIIPFLIQVLLFVSPVFYPLKVVENDLARTLLELNPIAVSVSFIRYGLGLDMPPVSQWLPAFAIAIAMAATGLWYFRRTESYFADIA